MFDEQAVRAKLAQARGLAELPEGIWPRTYQDGVAAALAWVAGEGRDPLTPLGCELEPRLVDVRHLLPTGWRTDFARLHELRSSDARGRAGFPVERVPWLRDWLETAVPRIISQLFTLTVAIDDRIGQHILVFCGDDWFPWHSHGFDDSYISFVLYPFDHTDGGEIRFSNGETLHPRGGYAAIFDGRGLAHSVAPSPTIPRWSITAFYKTI